MKEFCVKLRSDVQNTVVFRYVSSDTQKHAERDAEMRLRAQMWSGLSRSFYVDKVFAV